MHYTDLIRQSGKPGRIEWITLGALFLLAGIVGHDPWKQDETYSFGIIYHFLTSGTWLVPINAGTPFMEKPPLYYWTAVIFCKGLRGLLPLHDAARLASLFYMGIACAATWATSQILFQAYRQKRQMGAITLALFLGTLGLVKHAHDMFTDVSQLAGMALAVLGLALLINRQRRWAFAGMSLGLGAGIAFLSKGLFIPVLLSVSGIGLFCCIPQLRTRRTGLALLVAFLAASPFFLIWPAMLYHSEPLLFREWFWENNVGRFIGFSVRRLGADNGKGYICFAVLWCAFPTFYLSAATLYTNRKRWDAPEYALPAVICITGLALLACSASARALYLLPLFPAFALLAAPALIRVPQHALILCSAILRMSAGLLSGIIFTMWLCLLHPAGPQPFARLYGEWLPLGFLPGGHQPVACLAAAVVALMWLASFRLKGDIHGNMAYFWLLMVALPWSLMNTLLLPWLDETRSFRPVLTQLDQFVGQPPYVDQCIARHDLGESVSPMWEYFGRGRGLGPEEDFNGKSCPLLLLMTGKSMAPVSDPRWHKVWRGSRLLDSKDELQLFVRNP